MRGLCPTNASTAQTGGFSTLLICSLIGMVAASGAASAIALAGSEQERSGLSTRAAPDGEVVAQARTGPLVPEVTPPATRDLPVPRALPKSLESPGIIRKPKSPPKVTAPPVAPLEAPEKSGARSLPITKFDDQSTKGTRPYMVTDDPPQTGSTPRKIINDPTIADPDKLGPKAIVLPDKPGEPLDSRSRVTPSDLDHLPYSAIGQITTVHASGAQYVGTGFMISPGVVLTAAHVLEVRGEGRASKVTFLPGCAAGTRTRADAQTVGPDRYRVAKGWNSATELLAFDYGIIVLPPAAWHAKCGALVLRPVEQSFVERHVRLGTRRFILAGFPSDRPDGTQWVGRGRFSAQRGVTIDHKIDTATGQSGAPIIAVLSDPKTGRNYPLAVAIHSRIGAALAVNHNSGRRLDEKVLREIRVLASELGAKLE